MENCNFINNNPCNTTNTCNTPSTNECCCCPESMRKALNLISNTALANYINFNQFAFVGTQFSVGGAIDNGVNTSFNPNDNLPYSYYVPAGEDDLDRITINTTFQCVECNLVRISNSDVFYLASPTIPTPTITVNYLSLCDLTVVKFQVDDELFANPTAVPGECLGSSCTISTWASFKAYFRSLLDKKDTSNCQCTCDPCCCENDILNKVNTCTGGRGPTVTINSGVWFGTGLEVLGKIGCVLVLTDNNNATAAADPNIFFVCLDQIGTLLV